jgi:hypothetical protein
MLTEAQIERFSRHILLREVGGVGQERLLAAHVAVPRLDEAGRALAMWLVRAGVGTLELPDDPSPSPGVDGAGLLEAGDAGRPLGATVRARLAMHGEVAFRPGGRAVEPGASAADGTRAALECMRTIVRGEG